MKSITIALLVALAALQGSAFASSTVSPGEQAAVAAFIAKEGTEKSADEDPKARKIIVEADPETRAYIAVLYTLEGVRGGTDWLQYIAVFARTKEGLNPVGPIRVGGKGLRSVELKAYAKGIVELSTLNYSASDAMCCPSVPGVTHVVMSARGLEEADARIGSAGTATNQRLHRTGHK